MPEPEINIGFFIAHAPSADVDRLTVFVRDVIGAAKRELEAASRAVWRLHLDEPTRLSGDEPLLPSDFLDEASLRMAEGPYDAVIVLTDVGLVSRRHHLQVGLASAVARVAVLSTRKMLMTARGRPLRRLEDPAPRANMATLLLHLLGHIAGLEHTDEVGDVMLPFAFDDARHEPLRFGVESRRRLARYASAMPDREHLVSGRLRELMFHLTSAARNPGQTLRPLVRSRAPLLPLALPGLATAAVAPAILLVFNAEIWDVGVNLSRGQIWLSAAVTIVAATCYLTAVQNLLFPRKEKRLIPEHMAIVNVSIFLTILLALVGLFIMVALLMLLIETYVFPEGLIETWPTLGDPTITLWTKIDISVFISTIGVITGALAGGLESRTLIRHLALFRDDP